MQLITHDRAVEIMQAVLDGKVEVVDLGSGGVVSELPAGNCEVFLTEGGGVWLVSWKHQMTQQEFRRQLGLLPRP